MEKPPDPKVARATGLPDFLEVETKQQIPISPDGEQLVSAGFRVEALKQRLPFVLPEQTA